MKGCLVVKPVISEKAALSLNLSNKYVVVVPSQFNKIEVKAYIEKKYFVKVLSVNSLYIQSKKRRRQRIEGETQKRKKMVLTLKKGDQIEKLKCLY